MASRYFGLRRSASKKWNSAFSTFSFDHQEEGELISEICIVGMELNLIFHLPPDAPINWVLSCSHLLLPFSSRRNGTQCPPFLPPVEKLKINIDHPGNAL